MNNYTSGSDNSAFGYAALGLAYSYNRNTAVGAFALDAAPNVGDDNTAVGNSAVGMTGTQNTGVGSKALYGTYNYDGLGSYSPGSYNTATGFQALFSDTTGGGNVADGWQALYSNRAGEYNVATGASALRQNTTGSRNTASGLNCLYYNNGQNNSAYGAESLQNNSAGNNNTAVGYDALFSNNTGSNNIALGYQAGLNVTGSNNIDVGHKGIAGESAKIRIGTKGTHNASFIAGIHGKTVPSGTGVIVNANGQLGTVQSSARFKEAIGPMEEASEAILKLKPVTFHYKEELDPDKIPQFGLVAEEVEKVDPNLVVRGEDGKVMTVRYEAVNAMLLNEFLKENRKVQDLEKQVAALTAGLQKVTARVEAANPVPRVVSNN
jgi:hypothetical protein